MIPEKLLVWEILRINHIAEQHDIFGHVRDFEKQILHGPFSKNSQDCVPFGQKFEFNLGRKLSGR
jgi:hypothetical protein